MNTWLKPNKLAINVDKSTSKCMFLHKRRAITPLKFSMNNRTIDDVHKFKYLLILTIFGLMSIPYYLWGIVVSASVDQTHSYISVMSNQPDHAMAFLWW